MESSGKQHQEYSNVYLSSKCVSIGENLFYLRGNGTVYRLVFLGLQV